MRTYKKIIFVCMGNTCRSPMAATVMTDELKGEGIVVDSRGMVVLFPEPYNPKAVAVAAGYGYVMPSNNARQLENEDFSNDTLVLVMSSQMKQKIYNLYDKAINVYTVCEFAGEPEYEVEDPYGRGIEQYDRCFRELKELVEKAAGKIIEYKISEEKKEN